MYLNSKSIVTCICNLCLICIAESLPNSDGFNVGEYSGTDLVFFSLYSNSTTNWITSLDYQKSNDYTDNFEAEDKIYASLSETQDQFCIVKLNIENGILEGQGWYRNSIIISPARGFHFNVVSENLYFFSQID